MQENLILLYQKHPVSPEAVLSSDLKDLIDARQHISDGLTRSGKGAFSQGRVQEKGRTISAGHTSPTTQAG